MGTAVGDRQRGLSTLTAAAAFVHIQIIADGIDIF
jgi:hypothetical protein